jgi:hypothetical protein
VRHCALRRLHHHVDGQAMKACQLQASAAVGKQITTIEGLSQTARIRSSRPGWRSACRNAAIARAARSCRPQPARQAQEPDAPEIEARWPTIFAVADLSADRQAIRRAAEIAQA